jgi:hypothetical protein
MSLRVTTFRVFTALTLASMTPACSSYSGRPVKAMSELAFQNRLLTNLPPEVGHRISLLLAREYNPCRPLTYDDEKSLREENRLGNRMTSLDMQSYLLRYAPEAAQKNCFSTAMWVGTGKNLQVSKAPELDERLYFDGFSRVDTINPYVADQDGYNVQINLTEVHRLKELKPGDVLLFVGKPLKGTLARNDAVVHAATYLGYENGVHYIFQKKSRDCGRESPFSIVAINDLLAEHLGYPTVDLENSHFAEIEVYRQGLEPGMVKRSPDEQTPPRLESPVDELRQSPKPQVKKQNPPKNSPVVSSAVGKRHGRSQRSASHR